jgi:hypothetical protein
VSFVILTAYAPPAESPASGNAGPASFPLLFSVAQGPASGSAGPASFPLLFNVFTEVAPDPDPDPDPEPDFVVDWRDHSPDLLLVWGRAFQDGLVLEAVEGDTLVLVDHAPAALMFAEPSLTALEWVDHVPTTFDLELDYGDGAYGAGFYGA